jgi:putative transposase
MPPLQTPALIKDLRDHTTCDQIDDGVWSVYFGALRLGRLLERQMKIEDAYGRLYRHR